MDNKQYDQYVQQQQSKLLKANDWMKEKIKVIDIGRQQQVYRYLKWLTTERSPSFPPFSGATVLCLGARLGGEVRAFKAMGALALGIDLYPGVSNVDVLAGDFHHLAFPDESFDYLYCNVLDHLFSIGPFINEAKRVLKPTLSQLNLKSATITVFFNL